VDGCEADCVRPCYSVALSAIGTNFPFCTEASDFRSWEQFGHVAIECADGEF
jgi:hypothetical protein